MAMIDFYFDHFHTLRLVRVTGGSIFFQDNWDRETSKFPALNIDEICAVYTLSYKRKKKSLRVLLKLELYTQDGKLKKSRRLTVLHIC